MNFPAESIQGLDRSTCSLSAAGVKALVDHPLLVWCVLLFELETLILRQIDQLRFCATSTDI